MPCTIENMIESFKLASNLGLDEKRKISTFSKGMKRQAALILGICSGTKYLFCDETFDGLDPVMRQVCASIEAYEVSKENLHRLLLSNCVELEDICDHRRVVDKGGGVLSSKT